MGTGGDFEVYPNRQKLGFDHGDGGSFAEAFGRHGGAQTTSFDALSRATPAGDRAHGVAYVDVFLTTEPLGPIVPFRLPASAYNGRTAKGRARRS